MIALLLCVLLLGGCSGGEPTASSSEASPRATSAPEGTDASGASEESSQAPEEEDSSSDAAASEINAQASPYFGTDNGDGTRTIMDMAGRTVTIPMEVKTVFSAVPTAEPLLYALAPETMIGWVEPVREETTDYLLAYNAALPAVGGWMGKGTSVNLEDLLVMDPDFILCVSPFTEGVDGNQNVEKADEIQNQTGIPVVWFNADFETTPVVIRAVAEYLGIPQRGEELAVYFQEKMDMLSECMSKIPADEQMGVYYGGAADGLSTAPEGGGVTEVLDFLNIENVADIDFLTTQGLTEVSIEQVITWNPDVILASGASKPSYKEITTNSVWADIEAVKSGRVYRTPTIPFYWFDRPTLMRLAGAMWTAKTIYPDACDYDLNAEIKEFFQTVFHQELTDEQVAYLMKN